MVLSRTLLESELFGHERGAFTGAYKSQPGRFEIAGRGSVLLDDVDDIPLDLQGKLVNVLQERKCERVGSTKQVDLSCRVICATKANLSDLVAQGRFRDDLYYRMNVVKIRVPALRERRGDIPALAEHFLKMYNERLGREVRAITPEAMQVLHAYDWPGNVRELEHVIERAVALCTGEVIAPAQLPEALRQADEDALYSLHLPAEGKVDLQELMAQVESDLIDWATALSKGRQTAAAEMLNLPRTTLQAKMAKRKKT
jgi:DNA-binding NtrC family response regulator